MIREFWVENFLSIKDRQIISFESTSDDTALDFLTIEVTPNCRLNKMAIFYGANASGKSNILQAIERIFSMMCNSYPVKDRKISFTPFALCKDASTKMFISFYSDSIRYDYSLEYCATHIIEEILEYYPSKSKALFYKRNFEDFDVSPSIIFGSTLEISAKTKRTLVEGTLNNHTVLSTFGKASVDIDAKPFANLYNWVIKYVHNINGDNIESTIIDKLQKVNEDQTKKAFYLNLLCKADFNISNFQVIADNRLESLNNVENALIQNIKSIISSMPDKAKFSFYNDIEFVNQCSDGVFAVPRRWQSQGTLKYIELIESLYDMVKKNHIYLLDEFSEYLHTDLLIYYLMLFAYNTDKSQLIITTHDICLLDEDFVRRDCVWLAEKSKKTASSTYTRISDMGLHKNISLYNAYRTGRLGAKPNVGSPYLNLTLDD